MYKRAPIYKPASKAFLNNSHPLPDTEVIDMVERGLKKVQVNWNEEIVESTKDPRIFGPPLWFSIHNFSAHYPIEPSDSCRRNAMSFIRTIPYLIPCKECFLHAQSYISKYSDDDLIEITKTRATLFEWSVNFHNFVNERLRKPNMSLNDAYNMYHNRPKIKVMSYYLGK